MSHFAVAVILHDGQNLDDLLAPYQENNMGDCPKQYLAFTSTEEECREEYEIGSTEKVKTPDGRLLWTFDNEAKGKGYEKVSLKFSELYPTFEEFMKDYHGSNGPDPETGKYGYWENPNAKWDWWQIGGRYSKWFKTKSGLRVDDCRMKDLDTSIDEEQYKKSLRRWEIVVEGAELLPGEEKPFTIWKPTYYLNQFGSKENYAEEEASNDPWAFITPDGAWHEKGGMGWFGLSDATQESRNTFHASWKEAVAAADPEDWVVIVDCHI